MTHDVASDSYPLIGTIDFDSGSGASSAEQHRSVQNDVCWMTVEPEAHAIFRRSLYVVVRDEDQGVEFLARTADGPFHYETNADTQYALRGSLEIMGKLGDGERLLPSPTRPRPGSPVFVFPDDRLERFLEITGDVYLGHLTGHSNVEVYAPSTDKNFLPRNVGIFGTVGSGKSNTAQVLVEEAVRLGWAVVLIDVEGEYVKMNAPTTDHALTGLLQSEHGLSAQGVDDFRVYVPCSGRSAADAPSPFKIPLAALDTNIVADVLDMAEGERRVFNNVTERISRHAVPEESNYGSEPQAAGPAEHPYTLQYLLDGLVEGSRSVSGQASIRLLPYAKPEDVTAAGTLRSKLLYLGRTGMLDTNETASFPELPLADLMTPGRLSVLDVSETDDRSRNLAIAYVLQGLFEQVVSTPLGETMADGRPRPPLLVVIEEVHTFVSRAAAPKMKAVLDNLQVISRRGRKRWMSLALVSQQPNHVPDEIFELTNTRFIHQLKSLSNLAPVRETTGSIDESVWAAVPAMGPGRAILTGGPFPKPLTVSIRPAQSRRMLTN